MCWLPDQLVPPVHKNLTVHKLTIPEFRAIYGLSKYPNIIFEKTTPITHQQPLIFKNTFWA